ncbi:MAG: hypothetical protein QOG02_1248, partial [Gaiellales bacterium]|nr:hypothetical protein [Gaiellales bacterium]
RNLNRITIVVALLFAANGILLGFLL